MQFAARITEITMSELNSNERIDLMVLNETLNTFTKGTEYAMWVYITSTMKIQILIYT